MKADRIFLPVSVNERHPTEEKNYHTSVGIVKYQILPPKMALKSGWQYGACPTYWLEEKQNVYVFTEDELKKLIDNLHEFAVKNYHFDGHIFSENTGHDDFEEFKLSELLEGFLEIQTPTP